MSGPRWRELLEGHPADWHARYHLGLVRYADGDFEGAHAAWRESLAHRRTPWVLRCLAESARLGTGGTHDPADLLAEAHASAPGVWQLTAEALRALIDGGRGAEALALVGGLQGEQNGRIRLLEAEAALTAGDLDRVGALLAQGIEVANYQEGETSLDELWIAYHERRLAGPGQVTPEISERVRREWPVPREFDFRRSP